MEGQRRFFFAAICTAARIVRSGGRRSKKTKDYIEIEKSGMTEAEFEAKLEGEKRRTD